MILKVFCLNIFFGVIYLICRVGRDERVYVYRKYLFIYVSIYDVSIYICNFYYICVCRYTVRCPCVICLELIYLLLFYRVLMCLSYHVYL